jgi:diguanylate cyclase (GGDEF)-like protein
VQRDELGGRESGLRPFEGKVRVAESISYAKDVFRRSRSHASLFKPSCNAVLLAIVGAVAISCAIGWTAWHNRQSALEEHQRSMNSMGIVIVEQTSAYLQLIDAALRDIQTHLSSQAETLVDYRRYTESSDFQSYVSKRMKGAPQVKDIAVIDVNGRALYSSTVNPKPLDASSRDYYRHFKSHDDMGLFIGSPSEGLETGESLTFARRVDGPDGAFLGLILGVVPTQSLSRFYQAAGKDLRHIVLLHRRDGTLLVPVSSPELGIGERLPVDSPWYKGVKDGGGTYADMPVLTGIHGLTSINLLSDYPLVVTLVMDRVDVFRQWRRETAYVVGFALAAVLVFTTLFLILLRQFQLRGEQNTRLEEAAIRLRERERVLRSYAEMSSDWFWEQDADNRFTFDSNISSVSAGDDAGKTRRDLGDPSMAEDRWTKHQADLAARRSFRNFRWERIGSDGELHFMSTNGDPTFDEAGRFTGYRGTGRDVTSERQTINRLARANSDLELGRQQFDAVLSNISHGICFFSPENHLLLCNSRYREIYNLSQETTLVGQSLEAIKMLQNAAGSAEEVSVNDDLVQWNELIAMKRPINIVVALKDARFIDIHYHFMPDNGWVATHEDITERHEAEASIAYMARHDTLTKLPNRSLFRERMDEAIAAIGRGPQFAVFCLDLNNFKQVNDTLGHPMGDALLLAVADRLGGCVRESDTVARLGGDEFAIIQVAASQPDAAEILASRIIQEFLVPFEIDGRQILANVSIGVAVAPNDGVLYETLMRDADIALYLAKTERRGLVRFFEPEMDSRIHLRRLLEQDLKNALMNGEFELYYQPQVNLKTRRICGFEALLRWHHPVRGFISPLEFIPVAEETGLIVAIGEWVLRVACREAKNWPSEISVAVNLSPIQFNKGDLVAIVRSALESSGMRPERLELEITESVFLHTTVNTMKTLHQLRAMGVSVALDDFGTGYSSLSYLHSFPFNKIKIDQSFVRDLMTSKESMSIIRAVTGLGKSLGIKTVAEGVETQAQVDKLREKGCTEVQGYFFSEPRPTNEIPALIEKLRKTFVSKAAFVQSGSYPATVR